jgi:DNA-directed RNA polymerase subunit RPC12/RpoP
MCVPYKADNELTYICKGCGSEAEASDLKEISKFKKLCGDCRVKSLRREPSKAKKRLK